MREEQDMNFVDGPARQLKSLHHPHGGIIYLSRDRSDDPILMDPDRAHSHAPQECQASARAVQNMQDPLKCRR